VPGIVQVWQRIITRDLTSDDVLFMSQKWLFLLCFAFCDIRVTKMR